MPIFKEDPKDPPVVDGLKTWAVNIVGERASCEMLPMRKYACVQVEGKGWEGGADGSEDDEIG